MRIAFAGTPVFAATALRALLDAGFEIAMVLTQPDRPAGRGLKAAPSPVKELGSAAGLEVWQPPSLRTDDAAARLHGTGAQVLVVAAYGLILPVPVLDAFPLGCVNIHASLLPRWRGAAPIQRAILAGDTETGISIMRMEQGLDTGPVYSTHATPISDEDSAGTLHDRLAALGGRCIVEALPQIERGELRAQAQPEAGVTYAHKIAKEEADIDWTRAAIDIHRQVRAFNPAPGAFTHLNGEALKIWKAVLAAGNGRPGQVIECTQDAVVVACGQGAIAMTELQKAGSRRMSAADFLRGTAVKGAVLGA